MCLRAEELPADLGTFRYATFAQSFHWMEREAVAAIVFDMLEPGGAFVHVEVGAATSLGESLPHASPPRDAIQELTSRYLGAVRRAGQGYLRHGTPGNEWGVLEQAGFEEPVAVPVGGSQLVERTVDDVVASVFAASSTAPHLFGARHDDFERDLRKVLLEASPTGLFSEQTGDVAFVFYRRP